MGVAVSYAQGTPVMESLGVANDVWPSRVAGFYNENDNPCI